jgi:hypothetical protein
MGIDLVPRKDAEFEQFFRNIADYVMDNAARWGHIPKADADLLEDRFSQWKTAYDKTLTPHIPQLTAEKNRVRLSAERALRRFVNRFLRFEPVTDLDRDKMGIPNRDETRTPHVEVTEVVEFELKLRNIREVVVNFWIKGQTHKAKPAHYDGALIVWAVLDAPPKAVGSLTRHTMASRTPHALEFDETERGRTVYIALSWQNERANIGQWSEIQSAVIP